MRGQSRRISSAIVISVGLSVLNACGNHPNPVEPSTRTESGPGAFSMVAGAGSVAPASVPWNCLAAPGCSASGGRAQVGGVAALSAPNTPSNLAASVSGSTVTLTWTAPSSGDAASSYVVEAGSTPGASNLAAVATGNTLRSFSANNVANGTYYVRVRAANGANLSSPSNEVVVTIGSTTSASLTGRWVGVSPDGLVIDAATGSCDLEEDIQLDLTQTGSTITGTMTERIRKVNPARPTCDTVGAVYGPWSVSGTAGAGTLTITVTAEKNQTSTYTGTFTATRIVLTPGTLITGAVMTLNRQ